VKLKAPLHLQSRMNGRMNTSAPAI